MYQFFICMTTSLQENDRLFFKLNEVLSTENINWELVKTSPKSTSNISGLIRKPTLASVNYEDVSGLVHMYGLRDNNGDFVKSFIYNDKEGKEKRLTCNGSEIIYVLNFKNITKNAIPQWKVTFNSPGLEIQPSDVVNAKLGFDGQRFVFDSVVANSRMGANKSLSHPIIFKAKLVNGKVAIAHDFNVFSGTLEPSTKEFTNFKSDGKWSKNEYQKALALYPLFFEANESGKRSSGNRVDWRYGDAFTEDGKDVGKDLSGGHFDAGDHLLTAMGEGYCFSNVGFILHHYKKEITEAGQWLHYLRSLRHATDWLIKITEVKDNKLNRFFHWIPYSKNTHNEWEIPEKSNHKRNTYTIDKNNRGSEPVHNTGACLAWAYSVFKSEDKDYADKCLYLSKILWDFGVKYPGKYQSQTVYASTSGFQDERVHHSVSLYAVTGDRKYLEDANNTWKSHIGQAYGWFNHLDNSSFVSLFLLAKYDGSDRYHQNVKGLFEAWAQSKNGVKTIDGKLRALNDWATCSQGSGMGGLFAFYSHFVKKNESMEEFNRSQLEYCLGNNKDNYSYVIGFGDNYLKSPHHRGSSGGIKMHEPGMNKHVLKGALIGGRKLDGSFPRDGSPSRSDWICAEVALNYEANIILSTAGALK